MDNLLAIVGTLILLPLVGAVLAGIFGKMLGRKFTHRAVVSLMAVSCALAGYVFYQLVLLDHPPLSSLIYTWASAGSIQFEVSLLIDRLSAVMALIVTFISLMVYIYTIGYMADDPGYQRFFSYISLFTFFMLVLVFAANFLLLFFGWEGVGLVSYLLIGFWFKREKANQGSLKAFLVNRVGDLGFVLAAATIVTYCGTLDYKTVFSLIPGVATNSMIFPGGTPVSVITVICLLLFVGAMGKSAQIPLHVWLPESMEGPTPISALIHAATMVTAGIYMVARMSPLFEHSAFALSVVLIMGATTCFFMGLLAIFQFDIKRVIAYSTLSQLGYMVVALGVSAYDAAIFHLLTHAFFKALLFLAAGSVIIALHHEQDLRKMGGLAKRMPITYLTFLMGSLALTAIPPFAGFYSKDVIIEAARLSTIPGATYAYFCVQAGAFVTAVYTFRALFMAFHGQPRYKAELKTPVQESPWVIWLPLVLLAIPSCIIGAILIKPMLFAKPTLLGNTIYVASAHQVLGELAEDFHGFLAMALSAPLSLTFWLALAGIATAWIFNMAYPLWADELKLILAWPYRVMQEKYGFDLFYQRLFVDGSKELGEKFYTVSDLKVIDGFFVNGSGEAVRWLARFARARQTGYLNNYTLVMVLGLTCFLVWYVIG